MNVKVIGAGMVWCVGHGAFEDAEDLEHAPLGSAFGRPQIPGLQVHQRFGEECSDVGIIRELMPGLFHGVSIGLIERRPVFGNGQGIALGDRFDQSAFHGGFVVQCGNSLLRGVVREAALFLAHFRVVDMESARVSRPPPCHCAGGINFGSAFERANGFVVVVAVEELDPLVETPLRLGRCGRHRTGISREAWIDTRVMRIGTFAVGSV